MPPDDHKAKGWHLMTRNLKALGLALVAVFATAAMTASAASASDAFTSKVEKTIVTGTSHDNAYTLTGANATFKCTTSQFTGTVINKSTEATVLPKYTGILEKTPHESHECSATLGNVTWDTNDCHYILTGNTDKEDVADKTGKKDAKTWITCPKDVNGVEKEITITGALGCTIHIPSQTPTEGGVIYANLPTHTGGSAVKVTMTVTGLTYTATSQCGLVGIKTEGNDMDWTGTVTLTGYEDLEFAEEGTKVKEGAQIPIEVSTEL
jgi:hypothetical protein